MKGISMPINVMVVVVLAIIVLIALLTLYLGVWNPSVSTWEIENAKNLGCQRLVSSGCGSPGAITISNFDVNGDGSIDSNDDLQDLCNNYYNCNNDPDPLNCCKELCGCTR